MGRQAPPQILRDIGVLILVDEQVPKAPLVIGEDVGIAGEQAQIVQQQVAKIDGVDRHQALLVLAVEIDSPTLREAVGIGGGDLLGAETAILPAPDLGKQKAGGPAPLGDVLRLHYLLQEADLVVGVEDREAGL